jgi:hypothetical protein
VAALNPALAAATLAVSVWRKLIYSLIWQSMMWRPGKVRFPHRREEPASYPTGHDRQTTRPLAGAHRSPDSQLLSGYALLLSRIRRHFLILIVAGTPNPHRGFPLPPAVIQHAMWLYHCFSLSPRDVS